MLFINVPLRHSTFNAVREILDDLGLDLEEIKLQIEPYWDRKENRTNVEISFQKENISDDRLRELKRFMKLEVPSWMIGWANPSIQGEHEFTLASDRKLKLHISIGGVYTCEVVGEEEIEPSEHDQREAAELNSMTAEQALAYVQREAASKLEVRTKTRYKCTPVK